MSEAREAQAAAARSRRPWLPPRWFIVLFWHGHRALVRVTRGRLGLWRPKPDGWGTLRLTTTGRRTGRPRQVVVGYFEDGRNLITMAMNGWGDAHSRGRQLAVVLLKNSGRTSAKGGGTRCLFK